MLNKDDYLRCLRSDIDRVVALSAAVDDWNALVPGCPGWTLREVVVHMGRVHRKAAEAVETGEVPQRDPMVPDHPAGFSEWLSSGGDQLLEVLDEDPARPAWSFVPGTGTAGFWQRRMALENAVHRRDVETSIASTTPIFGDLADDGIDEVVNGTMGLGIAQGLFTLPAKEALTLRTTDTGTTWQIGAGPATATVQGSAEQLFLLLWKRLEGSMTDLVWEGDQAAGREILRLPLTP